MASEPSPPPPVARKSLSKDRSLVLTTMQPGAASSSVRDMLGDAAGTEVSNVQIWEELRSASRKREAESRAGCASFLCRMLRCFTPDVVENTGMFAGKTLLKATVHTLDILQHVLGLDAANLAHSIKTMFIADAQDWDACRYDAAQKNAPGFLHANEMIYCCRLSLLAYLTNVGYDDFFPEHREKELLGRVFDLDGVDEVHPIFLVNYVSSLFCQDRNADGSRAENFGQAKPLETNLEPMSLELVRAFDVGSNQGFIAKSRNLATAGGDIVISFQGTMERNDAITSAQGTSTPFEPLWDKSHAGAYACMQGRGACCACLVGETAEQLDLRARVTDFGRVHVGFYNAFLGVKPILQQELEQLLATGDLVTDGKVVRIVVTGHSLGGALASLCTAWLVQWFRFKFPGGLPQNFRVLSVTFGQPKVGDERFARAMQNDEYTNRDRAAGTEAKFKTYRVFAPLDPVVTVPPRLLGFHHCYSMCALREGDLFFPPPGFAKHSDSTSAGLKNAIDQGMSILAFHDLFCYLSSVMFFADKNRVVENEDLEHVFGTVDYQAEVLQPGFLERF